MHVLGPQTVESNAPLIVYVAMTGVAFVGAQDCEHSRCLVRVDRPLDHRCHDEYVYGTNQAPQQKPGERYAESEQC